MLQHISVHYALGHYGGDERLKNIIARLEIRECFGHEEDDAGGHITDFKQRTGLRGKAVQIYKIKSNIY